MPRLLVLSLVLAACAGEPAEAPAPPDADVSVPTPAADGTDTPEALHGTPSDSSEWTAGLVDLGASGEGQAVLADVRVAAHDGYDRVAFEFESVRPAVHVEYVDEPVRACGSGEVVALPGDGWLLVRFSGARAHTEAGEATVDPATRDLGLRPRSRSRGRVTSRARCRGGRRVVAGAISRDDARRAAARGGRPPARGALEPSAGG